MNSELVNIKWLPVTHPVNTRHTVA